MEEKNDFELFADLENLIKSSNIYYSKAGDELNLRCCYCGDSEKSSMSKHMYVGIKEALPMYYCQRCHAKGVLNLNFLLTHNFNRNGISGILQKIPKSKHVIKKDIKQIYEQRIQFVNSLPPKKDFYTDKIEYFKKRTGINLLQDKSWDKYKVILSMKKFLEVNSKLLLETNKNFYMHEKFLEILDQNYIGFLSINNESIIFRNVTKNKELKRFFNIQLIPSTNVTFYGFQQLIPNDKFTIVLCEGIFDNINLSERLKNKPENRIYISVLNKDYVNKIDYLIERFGIKIERFEIYLDQDHNYLKQFSSSDSIKLFKNRSGKDYGEISESFYPAQVFTR